MKSKVKAKAEAIRLASVAVAANFPSPKQINPVPQPVPDLIKAGAHLSNKRKPKDVEATPKTKKAKVPDPRSDPEYFVSRRVRKFFENVIYVGILGSYDVKEELRQIDYDDGDDEEFDKDKLPLSPAVYTKQTNKWTRR